MRYALILTVLQMLFHGDLLADCSQTISETGRKSLIESAINLNGILNFLSDVDNVNSVSLTSSSVAIGGGQIVYHLQLYVDGTGWCNYNIDLSFFIQPSCNAGALSFIPTSYVTNSVTGGGAFCPSVSEIANSILPPAIQPFIGQTFVSSQSCQMLSIGAGYLCLDPYNPNDLDIDGDGFSQNEGDCNDAASSTFPGAVELADGIDNDCDGVIDERTTASDDDADGFSDAAGDCNDADPLIVPGGSDATCDGVDNDCSGMADDDPALDCDQDGTSYETEATLGTNPTESDNPVVVPTIVSLLLADDAGEPSPQLLPGDVNGDGIVNLSDAQCAILASLAGLSVTSLPKCLAAKTAADLNCDGTTNVADVQISIDYVIGSQLSLSVDGNQDGVVDECPTN